MASFTVPYKGEIPATGFVPPKASTEISPTDINNALRDCPICRAKNRVYALDTEVYAGQVIVTMSCMACSSNWLAACPPLSVTYRHCTYGLTVDKANLKVAKETSQPKPTLTPKRKICGD